MALTAILDVDGTLVDTNYHHAVAWYRAFRASGIVLPLYKIHRHQGMGGDQLVPALIGEDKADKLGDEIRDAEKEAFGKLINEVEPVEGATELITDLQERGHFVVLASSAKQEEVEHYLQLLDVEDTIDAWTTSADVDATKPEPDLVDAAIEKGPGNKAVMVGDTTFDIEAAQRAGVETIAVLTGGFCEHELHDAGALSVYESVHELRRRLAETPFR